MSVVGFWNCVDFQAKTEGLCEVRSPSSGSFGSGPFRAHVVLNLNSKNKVRTEPTYRLNRWKHPPLPFGIWANWWRRFTTLFKQTLTELRIIEMTSFPVIFRYAPVRVKWIVVVFSLCFAIITNVAHNLQLCATDSLCVSPGSKLWATFLNIAKHF